MHVSNYVERFLLLQYALQPRALYSTTNVLLRQLHTVEDAFSKTQRVYLKCPLYEQRISVKPHKLPTTRCCNISLVALPTLQMHWNVTWTLAQYRVSWSHSRILCLMCLLRPPPTAIISHFQWALFGRPTRRFPSQSLAFSFSLDNDPPHPFSRYIQGTVAFDHRLEKKAFINFNFF